MMGYLTFGRVLKPIKKQKTKKGNPGALVRRSSFRDVETAISLDPEMAESHEKTKAKIQKDLNQLAGKLSILLFASWSLYPLFVLIGSEGYQLVTTEGGFVIAEVLSFVSKTAFIMLSVKKSDEIALRAKRLMKSAANNSKRRQFGNAKDSDTSSTAGDSSSLASDSDSSEDVKKPSRRKNRRQRSNADDVEVQMGGISTTNDLGGRRVSFSNDEDDGAVRGRPNYNSDSAMGNRSPGSDDLLARAERARMATMGMMT